jgi:hypothetical protein
MGKIHIISTILYKATPEKSTGKIRLKKRLDNTRQKFKMACIRRGLKGKEG